jgi:hypothetical protein
MISLMFGDALIIAPVMIDVRLDSRETNLTSKAERIMG